jgi:hypothetical protein
MLRRLLAWIFRDEPHHGDDVVAQARAVRDAGGEPTRAVLLRLDPSAIEVADLQIRWEIEKGLRANSPELLFFDDGYGFARSSEAMLLWYATHEPEQLVDALVAVLTARLSAAELAAAVRIAICPRDERLEAGGELAGCVVVYPPDAVGRALPD